MLSNIEQKYGDTYADLHVHLQWITEARTITVEQPSGSTIQIKLNPIMAEGSCLRLKQQAFEGAGDLLLRICIVK
jgi:hypothetical protein